MRKVMLAIAVGAVSLGSCQAIAKSVPRKTAVKPAAKPSPTTLFVNQMMLNGWNEEHGYGACRLTNFKGLAGALEAFEGAFNPTKGEYETSEQYEARVAKIADLISKPEMVVCMSLSDQYDSPFSYNADKQQFKGEFAKRLRVDLIYKKLGSFIGKTRMNVSFKIERVVDIEYYAEMTNLISSAPSDCFEQNESYVKYSLDVPRADAPSVKSAGYLAIIGHLAAPYISMNENENTPSLDDPEQRLERDYTVTFKPDRFAIVMPGGKILKTCHF